MVSIRDLRVILTAPEGINLVVVRLDILEPGPYGLGCATFAQRCLAVATWQTWLISTSARTRAGRAV